MTINLSTLKEGDKVQLRNGEEVTIDSLKIDLQPVFIHFDEGRRNGYYQLDGRYNLFMESKFDIVKILPTPNGLNTKPQSKEETVNYGMFDEYFKILLKGQSSITVPTIEEIDNMISKSLYITTQIEKVLKGETK